MSRRLGALVAALLLALITAGTALASGSTLASTGAATSITQTSADLNAVVYRRAGGARWLFQYSTDPRFAHRVHLTSALGLHGSLTAVERKVTGLVPGRVYFWRVALRVGDGRHAVTITGRTARLQTVARTATPPPSPTTTTTTSTTTTATTTTTTSATTTAPTTTTSATPTTTDSTARTR